MENTTKKKSIDNKLVKITQLKETTILVLLKNMIIIE